MRFSAKCSERNSFHEKGQCLFFVLLLASEFLENSINRCFFKESL